MSVGFFRLLIELMVGLNHM